MHREYSPKTKLLQENRRCFWRMQEKILRKLIAVLPGLVYNEKNGSVGVGRW